MSTTEFPVNNPPRPGLNEGVSGLISIAGATLEALLLAQARLSLSSYDGRASTFHKYYFC